MLIPSIDLMGGRVVQLEQGERLALATTDLDGWMAKFAGFPLVQLIDLDAAMGHGDNSHLVEKVCRALPCQVGGGVRSADRARTLLASGARRVIVGSALFSPAGVNVERAAELADAVGAQNLTAAIDSRGGRVVIHGWKTTIAISAIEAIHALDPYVSAFLYTHVDTEGLLTGFDVEIVRPLAAATTKRLIAAGGIRSMDEVDALDRAGIDAVVGMAIYRGLISISGRGREPGSPEPGSPEP
jgi:phosphoribosylformimino-5-aminoimidazole carboxamide ribotide isomerase